MTGARHRPAWAEIDLGAVRHNAGVLARLAAPAQLCAVVKADAYGHGALVVARAALEGGASWLAVALVDEGVALREAGIEAPILLLSEPPPGAMADAVAAGLVPTLYTAAGIDALARAAAAVAPGRQVAVHLKVDTGMHRVGADPADVPALIERIAGHPALVVAGLWTHLAVADGPGDEDRVFTAAQLEMLDRVRGALPAAALPAAGTAAGLVVHAANSAAALAHPAARLDLVRCGIALYGELPAPHLGSELEGAGAALRPVLSLRARVAHVRELDAGARPSYGRHRPLPARSVVATVPLGYADGVPRRLFETGGEVLIGGARRPLAGMVTMDQIVVDCGPPGSGPPVAVGDEVVLLGTQGGERIGPGQWAAQLGTISYEILCGIGPRVPRVPLDGDPPD